MTKIQIQNVLVILVNALAQAWLFSKRIKPDIYNIEIGMWHAIKSCG
jgi:hypothetical protein